MNSNLKNTDLENRIFAVSDSNFNDLAIELFNYQYNNNKVYRQYCQLLQANPDTITAIEKIPFLPISFFKTHTITTSDFIPEVIFESSGTTQTINSKHLVKDLHLYKQSFINTFNLFYGNISDWCIIGLLPSYLERNNSSLVLMADTLIQQSNCVESGFYLDELEKLHKTLSVNEQKRQKTMLLGVTFALIDFAERFPIRLKHTTILETGGMKGRRKEVTRQEVHDILCKQFQLTTIHSEYGMTELLSQAYSYGNGIFNSPPWMKIMIRDEDDPLSIKRISNEVMTGAINIIDMANIYSCSFIATDDAGKLYPDSSFEIIGRLDNSDIRGCSLLSL